GGFEQRGGYVARRDGVDPDAVPGQFDGRRLGEVGDRGFGCAVGLHAAARLEAAHGGQVDDGAAAVSGHVTGGVAGARHDAEQVDAEHALEVGEVVVQEAAVHGAGDARVVAHDVQAAEGGDGVIDQGRDLFRVGHVDPAEDGRAAVPGRRRRTGLG